MYESKLTYKLGVLGNLDKHRKYIIKSNLGTSYRPPTFDDLYWSASAFARGNANLKPENAINFDIGLISKLFDFAKLEMSYFYNDISDLIVWFPGAGGQWRPSNIGKVTSQGFEGQVFIILPVDFLDGILLFSGNYTLLFATDKTEGSATYGKQIIKAKWNFGERVGFLAGIHITGSDTLGLVNSITGVISDHYGINMRTIHFTSSGNFADGTITLYVNDGKSLNKLMRNIKALRGVEKVERIDSIQEFH
jgi:outer membrane receptor protein involved in Fe transport